MKSVREWLESLDLGRHADAFEANEISWDVLSGLDHDLLKELGVTAVGQRLRILSAIDELGSRPADSALPSEAGSPSTTHPGGEAERRQLTVMFCDLVGSTRLSSELDLETYRNVLSSYQDVAREAVARYEGFIARYMGDGLLVYFGYPQAHEDDAERAVRTGLEIATRVPLLAVGLDESLAVRVGIATGKVVAGDIVGAGASEEHAVLGETPNLAARLQGIADPDTVVLPQATQRLIEGRFDLEPLGARKLRGIADSVPVYRAVRAREGTSRFEAIHGERLTPLRGRASELALLTGRWEQARMGEGQVVLLGGEPGIGKSRLVLAFREHLDERSVRILRYQCSPYHSSSAFHPVIDLIERAAHFDGNETLDEKLRKISAWVATLLPDDERAPALIADLLSLPTDRFPPLDMTPQKQRSETIRVLVSQVEALTATRPVLMLLEDVHWCDPSTLEFISSIVDHMQSLPVLLLVTHRPEFDPPWTGYGHVTRYSLNRLGRREIAEVVETLSDGKDLPEQVMTQILEKTDGIPLFVEELTKTVLEAGFLVDAGDRWRLDGPLPPLAIPSTLQDSLVARLDRLSQAREIAQIGACIGREFPYELIAAVSPLRADELGHALTRLTANALVFRRGEIPEATFIFKHALVQDIARDTLLLSRRQQIHGQIARALRALSPEVEEQQPELLAHHFAEAGLREEAIDYWKRAGAAALRRSANREAIAHLGQALELLGTLPDGPARDRLELALLLSLGGARMAVEGYAAPPVGEVYRRAEELCKRLGQVPDVVPALWGLWLFTAVQGRHEAALSIGEQLLALAGRVDVGRDRAAARVAAHRAIATSSLWMGRTRAAQENAEQAIALYDPGEHHQMVLRYGQDLGVSALYTDSWALQWLGYPDQALRRGKEALTLADDLDHPFSMAWTLVWWGLLHAYRGSGEAVEPIAARLALLSDEQGFAQTAALARILRGWTSARVGAGERAIEQLREGITGWTSTGARQMVSHWYAFLGEAYGMLGRHADGLAALDAATREVETTGQRSYAAEIARIRGDVFASRDGLSDEAASWYRKAIDIGGQQDAKFFVLRAAASWVERLAEPAGDGEALGTLRRTHDWFTEGFDTPDLRRAAALLKAVE